MDKKEPIKKTKIEKLFSISVGFIFGGISWFLVKYVILSLGSILLSFFQIYGARADANLSAVAEILGFITFILVFKKIHRAEISGDSKIQKLSEKQRLFLNAVSKLFLLVMFVLFMGMLNFMIYAQYFLKELSSIGEKIFLFTFINIPFLIAFITLYKFINQIFKNK